MRTTPATRSNLLLLLCILFAAVATHAADPPSGEVSEANPETLWTVEFKPPTGSAECAGPADPACDNFLLTITPPAFSFQVEITVTPFGIDDWDLEVYGPSGDLVGSSGNNPGSPETVTLTNPEGGVYTVAAAPFAPTMNGSGVAKLVPFDEGDPPAGGGVPPFVSYGPPGAGEPGYAPSSGQAGLGLSAGEPSIGIPVANNLTLQSVGLPPTYPDPEPDLTRALYISGLETLRLTWDDCTDPALGLWEDKSAPTHVATLDPILETDQLVDPSRTHSLQLNAKRSLYSFSDDDGDTWTESVTGGGINSGVDHQTVGMGEFPALGSCPVPLHPTATYYASQDVALAQMAASCDGGLTFETANPMWNLTQCGGVHGHIEVAPDGIAYVPNRSCGGEQAAVATENGALTFDIRPVPGSTPPQHLGDPAIGIGHDAGDPAGEYTLYFGWANGDGRAMIAVSDDHGVTWSAPVNVGAVFGIQNTAFPAVVAGDRDRAAFAFMGSTTGGDGTAADPTWPGIWHLYLAVTYDRGQTWSVDILTPGDPVQRGAICMEGTTCASNRNLLDFMDVQKDEKGRLLVSWADGCVGGCVNGGPNSNTDIARVSRQIQGGLGMLAAFDHLFVPDPATVPKSPFVQAARFPEAVELSWSTPFDGGDALLEYHVFRREEPGSFALLATLPAGTNSHQDATVSEGVDYVYQVLAVNAVGSSAACFEAPAEAPLEVQPCALPGVQLVTDATGDHTGGANLDLEALHVAEPFLDDGVGGTLSKLVFTLDLADLTVTEAGNAWIIIWSRQFPDPNGPGGQVYDRNMVNLRIGGLGPECHFGKVTAPSVNQGDDLVTLPAEDCVLRPDGTLTIAVDTAIIDDCDSCPIGAGYEIAGLEVRVFQSNASGQPITLLTAQDSANGLTYTLFGNEFCRPNLAPVAVDDAAVGPVDQPLTIDVLANDSDPDGDALSVVGVTDGAGGTVSINPDDTVTYDPQPGFSGGDVFTYEVSDGTVTQQAVVSVYLSTTACTAAPLFTDGFESGDTTAWDFTLNPDGDLAVTAAAALDGAFGLEATVDDGRRLWVVEQGLPVADNYCFSFLFDPNGITVPDNEGFSIFEAGSGGTRFIGLVLRGTEGGGYEINAGNIVDGGGIVARSVAVGDAPVLLAGEWRRSDGGDNGTFRLFVDNALAVELTDLDNDTASIRIGGVGMMNGFDAGTSGVVYFDRFEHRQ